MSVIVASAAAPVFGSSVCTLKPVPETVPWLMIWVAVGLAIVTRYFTVTLLPGGSVPMLSDCARLVPGAPKTAIARRRPDRRAARNGKRSGRKRGRRMEPVVVIEVLRSASEKERPKLWFIESPPVGRRRRAASAAGARLW
jgi:hypothetical protein